MNNKIISHKITPFNRFGVRIDESLWLNGEPYFTLEAISKWLGYEDLKSVFRLIRRNSYLKEFSKKVKVLTMETYGKKQEIEVAETATPISRKMTREITVFDLMGMQQIVMLSSTKRGNEFRIAASKLIIAFMRGDLVPRSAIEQEAEAILAEWIEAKSGEKKALAQAYATKAGVSEGTAYRHLKKLKSGESPFDHKHGGGTPPAMDEKLKLQLREKFFDNPDLVIRQVWREIDPSIRPSETTLKRFFKSLREERALAEGVETVHHAVACPNCQKAEAKLKKAQSLNAKTKRLAKNVQGLLAEIEEVK